jgi:predicted NBD/HSP70 family sugar kinase
VLSNPLGSLAAASRGVQRAAVVAILRDEQISRSALISRLGVSSSLVTRLVRGLIDESVVEEVGAATAGLGRPRVKLGLRAGYGHLVAVSCESARLRAAVYDLHGAETRVNVTDCTDQVLSIATVISSIEAVQSDASLAGDRLMGIGISVPGVVDAHTGAVSEAPDLGWRDVVPLGSALAERYKVPVTVDNDVNLMVSAERERGGAVGVDDVVYLYVGRNGVGSGVISDGRLLQGGNGAAGEVGLVPLVVGHMGDGGAGGSHLEGAICAAAIARALEQGGLDAAPSPIPALIRWADLGNEDARVIRSDVLDTLAHAVLILSAVLDPTVVLVGGAARDLSDVDLKEMTARLASQSPTPPALAFAQLDSDAVLHSAQTRCWRRVLAGGI